MSARVVRSSVFRLLSFTLSVALLSGCASSARIDEVERVNMELRAVQADHTAQMADLKTDVRRLQGLIEEFQHSSSGKAAELEKTLQAVQSRVPPPPGVPEDLLNRDDSSLSGNSSPAAEMYRQNLQRLRGGQYDLARQGFEAFIQQNPGTAFTDNAYFWLGVIAEQQGQLDRAVSSYSDVFKKFPAEDMVPAAFFRLAETFNKLGSKGDALLTFQKLVDEFPRSAYASQAQTRIKELSPAKGGRR